MLKFIGFRKILLAAKGIRPLGGIGGLAFLAMVGWGILSGRLLGLLVALKLAKEGPVLHRTGPTNRQILLLLDLDLVRNFPFGRSKPVGPLHWQLDIPKPGSCPEPLSIGLETVPFYGKSGLLYGFDAFSTQLCPTGFTPRLAGQPLT